MAAIGSGKVHLEKENCNFSLLVSETTLKFEPLALKRKINIDKMIEQNILCNCL